MSNDLRKIASVSPELECSNVPSSFPNAMGLCRGDGQQRCYHCGKQTVWFSLSELLFFCCGECYRRFTATEHGYRTEAPVKRPATAAL